MEKINVAELLKDCTNGMELDCVAFNNATFQFITKDGIWIKYIDSNNKDRVIHLTCYGGIKIENIETKCIIFPKGKTTWEGFERPFEDGDIVFTHANCLKVGLGNTWISIFQEKRNGGVATYVDASEDGEDYYDYIDGDKALLCMDKDIMRQRLATEEEKEKLFQAIKANGYKWNSETKTLEKIGYQYPKTYEECCEVFEDNFLNVICLSDDEKDLFYNIIKIKRCRDAYWRIYGEQMGLGKPWEPDFLDDEQLKFCIYKSHNNILPGVVCKTDEFLVFPTEEMRDAFDENFKELINKCKELL